MPRKAKPKWPPLPKREYGTGSLSRDQTTGIIRARLPTSISPNRQAKEFKPDEAVEAGAWIDAALSPDEIVIVSMTLVDWTSSWYETYIEPILSPNTARWNWYALRKLVDLDDLPLNQLRPSHLQSVAGTLAKTLTPATLLPLVGVWRRCLQAAVDDDLIVKNPASRIRVPKASKADKTERRHVTPGEIDILWPAIRGHRFEAAYALMLGCGLRIGEILGLHWEHVDFTLRRAWIQRQFTNGHWRAWPKGSNPHWVRLPTAVIAALKRQRLMQRPDNTLVMQTQFPRPQKKNLAGGPRPWSRTVVVEDLAKLLVFHGIDPMSPHAGRHGLASWWLDGGVPASAVAERLGHSNAGVTTKFYSHSSPSGHAMADKLAEQLLPQEPPEPDSEAESA